MTLPEPDVRPGGWVDAVPLPDPNPLSAMIGFITKTLVITELEARIFSESVSKHP